MSNSSSTQDLLYWSLEGIDICLPEYIFREDFAVKLSEYPADKILTEAVYIDKEGMKLLVDLATKELLDGIDLSGKGMELGAGTGLLSSTIANNPKVESIYSIEIVKNMADLIIPKVASYICGPNSKKVIPVCGSFDILEIEDESLDFIVEIGSLHHSPHLLSTLKEASRVLKKGGKMLCFDRSHSDKTSNEELNDMLSIEYSTDFLKSNGYPVHERLSRAENGEHEIRLSEWTRDFEEAGLEVKDVKYFIKPNLRSLIKGILFSLPYFIRKRIYRTVNMGNYQKQVVYYLNNIIPLGCKDIISSTSNSTVFLTVKK
jgi:ubiquinone/menaquinone biosynthesis C-methylase UbiE